MGGELHVLHSLWLQFGHVGMFALQSIHLHQFYVLNCLLQIMCSFELVDVDETRYNGTRVWCTKVLIPNIASRVRITHVQCLAS